MHDVVPVEVLEAENQLAKVSASLLKSEGSLWVLFSKLDIQQDPAWHVLQHKEKGICFG